ncbi:hypothetical protein Lal_00025613 [Lupinus albus]|nr:hypothetical protein Lal_00025613 [Lupinus albus]
MEFLRLEYGNMSFGEYAPSSRNAAKCSKFESGLKPKLKMMFGHQEISDFPTLVNKCRILCQSSSFLLFVILVSSSKPCQGQEQDLLHNLPLFDDDKPMSS